MHDPATGFLRQLRRRDPARYREVCRRFPVLSTFQVDARKRGSGPWPGEAELREASEDGQGGYRPGTVDRLIHRDWLGSAFQEAA